MCFVVHILRVLSRSATHTHTEPRGHTHTCARLLDRALERGVIHRLILRFSLDIYYVQLTNFARKLLLEPVTRRVWGLGVHLGMACVGLFMRPHVSLFLLLGWVVYVRVCVCARACVYVRVCMCACLRACVRVNTFVCVVCLCGFACVLACV